MAYEPRARCRHRSRGAEERDGRRVDAARQPEHDALEACLVQLGPDEPDDDLDRLGRLDRRKRRGVGIGHNGLTRPAPSRRAQRARR